MAVNAGTVYYTVDADTQKAIDAAAEMNKSLESVQTTMAKADQQIKKHTQEWTKSGNTISKTGVVLDQFGDINVEATAKMQKLLSETEALSKQHLKLTKTAKAVNAGMSSMGRSAGQVGVQVQQLVGQIQGGQDKFQAFAAQAADIGIVLGAPLLGVIVALGAALGGTLAPALFDSKNATEELEDSLKSIESVIKTNSDGINVLSNDYANLVKKSEELAKSQLLLAKVRVDQVLNKASEAAEEAFDKFDTFFNAMDVSANVSVFDTLDDAMQRTDKSVIQLLENTNLYGTGLTQLKSAVSKLNSEFGTTTDQSALVLRRFAEFREQKTPEAFEKLSNTLLNIAETSRGKVSPEFVELVSTISNQAFAAKNAAEQSALLEKALNGISVATESSVKGVSKWADAAERLSIQTESLRSNQLELEKAIAVKKATEEGAKKETIDSIDASYNKLIANAKEAESEKALAKAKQDKAAAEREAAQAEKESREASQNFIKNFGLSGEKEAFDPNDPDNIATGISKAVIEENKSLLESLEEQRKNIEDFRDWNIGDAETHAEALIAIDEKIAAAKRKNNQELLNASSDFFGESAELVGAFAGEQSSAYKALFAVSKAFAIADAAINMQVAISKALAMGYPANIPLMAQAAASGSQIASNISSISLAGMAHDGISEVPTEGTWLLNKGERVYTNDSARQLDQMYSQVMKPSYPSQVTGSSSNAETSESSNPINLNVEIVNEIDGAQYQTQVTEEGVKIIAKQVFKQNIGQGVADAINEPSSRAQKAISKNFRISKRYS